MEPFRPYLIGLAVVAIGYAWYNYFKPKKADDCGCDIEKPNWYQTKVFLVVITLFAAVSIAFPYYVSIFYTDTKKEVVIVNESNIQTVNFNVKGMTCYSCEEHVKNEVNKLKGIVNLKVSYEKGITIIEFDKTKTNETEIKNAINSTGYNVINKKEK